mmetsp:Transcript_14140/g.22064  ORF Transcript_14140/g.22064 Transcript_14140/m.22064 type:complete len:211 (-) Transcript_14140:307-939(-)
MMKFEREQMRSAKRNTCFRRHGLETKFILFDLFPSIFLSYLDVETFCSLLNTDLWDWQHLLQERAILDYCHYLSIRHRAEIERYCQIFTSDRDEFEWCAYDSSLYDSSDTIQYDDDDEEEEGDDEDEDGDDAECDYHCYRIQDRVDVEDEEEQNFAILRLRCDAHSVHAHEVDTRDAIKLRFVQSGHDEQHAVPHGARARAEREPFDFCT